MMATERVAVFEGHHDRADCFMIFGWVWNMDRPDTVIKVEIYDGNILFSTRKPDIRMRVPALQYHILLSVMPIISNCHGCL
jgi:hypothetical protein